MNFDVLSFIFGKLNCGSNFNDVVSYLLGKAVSAVWKIITDVAVASFTAVSATLRELVVDITPTQSGSGNPSPTNIRPISGWTGAIITRADKNLFNPAAVTEHYYIAADGTVIPFEDAKMSDYIKVSSGKWILDSAKLPVGSAGNNRIHAYDANKEWIEQIAAVSNGRRDDVLAIPITVPEGAVYIRFSMPLSTRGYTQYLQFERGEIATDYDAYFAETYPVSWQSEAGTVYGGTLNVMTGLLTIDKIGVDMGSLNWSYNPDNTYFGTPELAATIKPPVSNAHILDAICSQYKVVSLNTFGNGNDGNLAATTGGGIRVGDSRYTDKDSFIAAVTGQTLVYPLASPQTVLLSPTEVKSLLGTNNIFADCGNINTITYRER